MNQTLSHNEKLKAIYAEYDEKMNVLNVEQDIVLNDFLDKIREARKEEIRGGLIASEAV